MAYKDNDLKSLLVVDDDDQFRNLLKIVFSRINYQVITAADGSDALGKMRQAKVDLVILDMIMPEKDGLETLNEIKIHYPATKVMAISGGNQYLNASMLLETARILGANDTLHKPFDLTKIIGAVENLLN